MENRTEVFRSILENYATAMKTNNAGAASNLAGIMGVFSAALADDFVLTANVNLEKPWVEL